MKKFFIVSLLIILTLTPSTASAMGKKPAEVFPVEMSVDFGPAAKTGFKETVYVEKGTTPKEAVSQVFPILSGKSCCSLREVIAIDGVKVEPSKGKWWICLVNGSKKISPQEKKLAPHDKLEWKYIQDEEKSKK